MLEDLTNGGLTELTKYAGLLYQVEKEDFKEKDFKEKLRKAIVGLEEVCRFYFRNNYDIAPFLNIAHEFRKEYFNGDEETKVIKRTDIQRRIIEERQKKFRELLD